MKNLFKKSPLLIVLFLSACAGIDREVAKYCKKNQNPPEWIKESNYISITETDILIISSSDYGMISMDSAFSIGKRNARKFFAKNLSSLSNKALLESLQETKKQDLYNEYKKSKTRKSIINNFTLSLLMSNLRDNKQWYNCIESKAHILMQLNFELLKKDLIFSALKHRKLLGSVEISDEDITELVELFVYKIKNSNI